MTSSCLPRLIKVMLASPRHEEYGIAYDEENRYSETE